MAEAFNPELHEAISLREDDEAVFDVSRMSLQSQHVPTLCTVLCTFFVYPTCFVASLFLLFLLYLVMESIYKDLCYWI